MTVALGWLAVASSVAVAVVIDRARRRHENTHAYRMAALRRCSARARTFRT